MRRSYFTTSFKLIGIANSFSGGIFLCVALLHLLPESAEIFEEYFEHTSVEDDEGNAITVHKHFPISFLLAFTGYTIILIIEKVIFDSHTHLDADDDEAENLEDAKLEDKIVDEREIQQVNVNNNFNITIPVRELSLNSTKKSKIEFINIM
jgi:zinc transporter 1/2/3